MITPKINKLYILNNNIVILRGINKDKTSGVFEFIDPHESLHDGTIRDYWYDIEGNDIYHNRNKHIKKYYYKPLESITELTDLQKLKGLECAIEVHSREEWGFLLEYFKCPLPNYFIDNQTNYFDLKDLGCFWGAGELREDQKKIYSILDINDIFPNELRSLKLIDEMLNILTTYENNK